MMATLPNVRRLAAVSMALLLAAGVGVGCAGKQKTDEQAEVQARPPKHDPPKPIPQGPEIKDRSDYPKEAIEGGTAEREMRAERRQPIPSGAETITEAQRETFLEMGASYVFQVVTLEPAQKNGEFRGYEIVEAEPHARKVMNPQLEVGDIVTHVNDIRIERPRDYMKAWNQFGAAERFHIDFLRDGEEKKAVWVIRSNDQ